MKRGVKLKLNHLLAAAILLLLALPPAALALRSAAAPQADLTVNDPPSDYVLVYNVQVFDESVVDISEAHLHANGNTILIEVFYNAADGAHVYVEASPELRAVTTIKLKGSNLDMEFTVESMLDRAAGNVVHKVTYSVGQPPGATVTSAEAEAVGSELEVKALVNDEAAVAIKEELAAGTLAMEISTELKDLYGNMLSYDKAPGFTNIPPLPPIPWPPIIWSPPIIIVVNPLPFSPLVTPPGGAPIPVVESVTASARTATSGDGGVIIMVDFIVNGSTAGGVDHLGVIIEIGSGDAWLMIPLNIAGLGEYAALDSDGPSNGLQFKAADEEAGVELKAELRGGDSWESWSLEASLAIKTKGGIVDIIEAIADEKQRETARKALEQLAEGKAEAVITVMAFADPEERLFTASSVKVPVMLEAPTMGTVETTTTTNDKIDDIETVKGEDTATEAQEARTKYPMPDELPIPLGDDYSIATVAAAGVAGLLAGVILGRLLFRR